jgi:hypothetical protein
MIRIANGQGFWGDWLEAPVRLVEQGPIDFLTLDYLVSPWPFFRNSGVGSGLGYARDFVLMARIAQLREGRMGCCQCGRPESSGSCAGDPAPGA